MLRVFIQRSGIYRGSILSAPAPSIEQSVTDDCQDNPEPWDFEKMETTPGIVVINLGTNDNNVANNVSAEAYVDAYKKLIQGVHGKYPNAQVVVMVVPPCFNTKITKSSTLFIPINLSFVMSDEN